MSGASRWVAAVLVLAAVVTACQEKLTSPADCPQLCPGGSARVLDTVVPATANRDSSFPNAADFASGGYIGRGRGVALLLSSGYAASEDRAIYRFFPRSDQVRVLDTLRSYTVDSATISVTLLARDTLVQGLRLYLYRLPSAVDSTATFATIDPLLADPNLIDSVVVPDTLRAGTVTATLQGDELGRIALTGADSTLAIGLRMTAVAPTGVRVGSVRSNTGASFTTFVTADVLPDTGTIRKQTFSRGTAFNTFVTQNPVVPVDSLLTIGGEPSSRALIRFDLPDAFLDSSTIVRATLELTPARPIIGLRGDPAFFYPKPVLGDIGAKSPVDSLLPLDTLPTFVTDTVRLDVTNIVRLWQAVRARPHSIYLQMLPEAATFARGVFYSSRSHGPDPSVPVAPRLRVTYQRAFPFENP
ncbi:MAG TPA: hypothetical protein VHR43_02970 [Gemmatimonadales bacterium]|nr:hypothetical protein [Gemmatimonadales bacterium]